MSACDSPVPVLLGLIAWFMRSRRAGSNPAIPLWSMCVNGPEGCSTQLNSRQTGTVLIVMTEITRNLSGIRDSPERRAIYGTQMEAGTVELIPMPMCQFVATRSKDDPQEMYDLLGSDATRKTAAIQFKNINSNFKIAIVVDLWLTGLDVPFLDCI